MHLPWIFLVILNLFFLVQVCGQHQHQHHHTVHSLHGVSNNTIVGDDKGCQHTTQYVTTSIVSFPMCIGQTNQDLKNGMSIINLIQSRGYLPTCRILQLMLWMASEVNENQVLPREVFVDIGSNIGSCAVHMASLGFPVIAVEPVQQHVNTIKGTMELNPSFHIDLHHGGISSVERIVKVNFGHGSRNWGASEFHEINTTANETYESELLVQTFDQVVNQRRISLVKIDCEGCEWDTLKGAKRALKRIPMIKIELVQPEYTSGNETVPSAHILQFLQSNGFDLFIDRWAENSLYFGNHGNELLDIDKMFGSTKFKIKSDRETLYKSAKSILESQFDASAFNRNSFLKQATDVIAIEKSLSNKMKQKFIIVNT